MSNSISNLKEKETVRWKNTNYFTHLVALPVKKTSVTCLKTA
jgi:hypothetical protein